VDKIVSERAVTEEWQYNINRKAGM